jgi:hypothetical protein
MKRYRVPSSAIKDKMYIVRFFKDTNKYICDCPSYAFSKSENPTCKHIKKVIAFINKK